ncbi:MAG: hypothetical protein ABIH86_06320 [Planctomycetota bacterium]
MTATGGNSQPKKILLGETNRQQPTRHPDSKVTIGQTEINKKNPSFLLTKKNIL